MFHLHKWTECLVLCYNTEQSNIVMSWYNVCESLRDNDSDNRVMYN